MKTITHIACLLVGIGLGFPSGQWRGEAITLQAATAPAIDPTYANALSDDAVYRTRAKIEKPK